MYEVKFNTLNERIFYRHVFASRLNELRHKYSEAAYHRRQAESVYVRHGAYVILKAQARSAAYRVYSRYKHTS